MVDVTTEITVDRPADEVAAYASDPASATEWYENIATARLLTPPPLAVGSQIEFRARFLGRELAYTYERLLEAARAFHGDGDAPGEQQGPASPQTDPRAIALIAPTVGTLASSFQGVELTRSSPGE